MARDVARSPEVLIIRRLPRYRPILSRIFSLECRWDRGRKSGCAHSFILVRARTIARYTTGFFPLLCSARTLVIEEKMKGKAGRMWGWALHTEKPCGEAWSLARWITLFKRLPRESSPDSFSNRVKVSPNMTQSISSREKCAPFCPGKKATRPSSGVGASVG